MIYLRQSTASQEIPLGYFVDSTDGNTEETGLTIANTDIKIWKSGATALANKTSGGATHISNGIYYAVLDATDTDTIGPMAIFCHVSGALTVRLETTVLDEAMYDWMFGTAAPLAPTVAGRTLDVTATGAAGIDWGNVENKTTANDFSGTDIQLCDTITTYTGNTVQTGDAFARLGAPAGVSVSADIAVIEAQTDDIGAAGAGLTAIPWNAAWDAEVQSEAADALTAYDPPTHAEMTAELATADDAVLAAIAALNDLSAAEVNAEMVDVMATDTYAESSAVVGSSATIAGMLTWLKTLARNKITQTTTTQTLRNNGDTADVAAAAVSDDGTTFTRGKWA